MDNTLEPDNPKVIFIGGTGRSGSNVSQALLEKHPQVASLPFSYRFTIDPDGIVDFYQSYTASWSPFLADRRLKRLESLLLNLAKEAPLHRLIGNIILFPHRDGRTLSPHRYHRYNLEAHLPNFKQHVRDMMAELREFSFLAAWVGTESYAFRPQVYHAGPKSPEELASILGRFFHSVIGSFLAERGKTVYVEDNTWNILFARELIQLVPQAKFLHVYRDPRDVVASYTQQRYCPSDPEQAALWYKSIMTRWLTVRADLPSGSYYEYRLEDLVNSTEQVVREICEFTRIPYAPALLDTDLSKSSTGRWKSDFSLQEQRMLNNILGDLIGQLGYEV